MITNPLAGSKQYKAEVVSFYHASLLAIHPFLDGNGRVARTVLDFQTKQHFLKTNSRYSLHAKEVLPCETDCLEDAPFCLRWCRF